jgi:hypothetical protein
MWQHISFIKTGDPVTKLPSLPQYLRSNPANIVQ